MTLNGYLQLSPVTYGAQRGACKGSEVVLVEELHRREKEQEQHFAVAVVRGGWNEVAGTRWLERGGRNEVADSGGGTR